MIPESFSLPWNYVLLIPKTLFEMRTKRGNFFELLLLDLLLITVLVCCYI